MEDTDDGGGNGMCRGSGHMVNLPSIQFFSEPKTALKIKIIKILIVNAQVCSQ